jgi:hypothetical protein
MRCGRPTGTHGKVVVSVTCSNNETTTDETSYDGRATVGCRGSGVDACLLRVEADLSGGTLDCLSAGQRGGAGCADG